MDDVTLTNANPSSVIIERDVLPDKSREGLLPILKISRWVSIHNEFLEGIYKISVGIVIPKESTTVVNFLVQPTSACNQWHHHTVSSYPSWQHDDSCLSCKSDWETND